MNCTDVWSHGLPSMPRSARNRTARPGAPDRPGLGEPAASSVRRGTPPGRRRTARDPERARSVGATPPQECRRALFDHRRESVRGSGSNSTPTLDGGFRGRRTGRSGHFKCSCGVADDHVSAGGEVDRPQAEHRRWLPGRAGAGRRGIGSGVAGAGCSARWWGLVTAGAPTDLREKRVDGWWVGRGRRCGRPRGSGSVVAGRAASVAAAPAPAAARAGAAAGPGHAAHP